ncbi:MAG: SAV_2336 N-terminal domain-related protein, partial [Synechococcaceae cyanobacterium]
MVAESRLELLDALIGWWAEQGGEANDARSIADWLWLHGSFEGQALPYRFVPAGGLSHATDRTARERQRITPDVQPDPLTQADGQATASGEPPQADPFTPSVFPEAPPPAPLGEASAHLLSPAALPDDGDVRELLQRRQGAVPLLLSQAPLLQRPLRLLGALAPILHKRPHPRRRVLAEERSAERSAELGLPWPVFQPRLQPAVEVRIWLDAGVAMAVWWPLAQELRRVLASSQALARVELHALQLDQLAAENLGGRVSGPASDATPLTLVLSDTAGRHWWDGSMAAWLERVARHQPVAILHTLPIRYQQRTALRRGVAATLSNRQTLGPNLGYRAVSQASLDPRQAKPRQQGPASGLIPPGPMRDPHPDAMAPWSKAPGLKLPVLTLDPRELAPWAAMVGGDAQARTGGTVLPIGSSLQSLPEAAAQRPADGDAAEAERLWLAFRQQASPEAQRLLQLMAAAPVLTLPVLRLLLAAELPELDLPLPLAEVLVSGLVRPCPGQQDRAPDVVQFELVSALQALLEAQLEPFQRVKVIRSITALLESRWNRQGHGDSFATLLTDPLAPLPQEAAGFAHIANVTAAMLDRLPGKPFRALAAQLRSGSGLAPPSPWPPAVAFEELVFEAAQRLEVPGLELVRVESARFIEQELRRIPFTTAGLQRKEATHPPGAEAEREYGVVEAEAETWGYHEPLAQIRLTMVQIPAGG